jgi:hypothetical protein
VVDRTTVNVTTIRAVLTAALAQRRTTPSVAAERAHVPAALSAPLLFNAATDAAAGWTDHDIRRVVARNVWNTIFGAPPSTSIEKALVHYGDRSGNCGLGETFHTNTFGIFRGNIPAIRTEVRTAARGTDLGSAVMAEAAAQGLSAVEAAEVLSQLGR